MVACPLSAGTAARFRKTSYAAVFNSMHANIWKHRLCVPFVRSLVRAYVCTWERYVHIIIYIRIYIFTQFSTVDNIDVK